MKISDLVVKSGNSLSFEFFPPLTPLGEERLAGRIKRLKQFNPSFISVTQHARPNTLEMTRQLVKTLVTGFDLTVMPHMTCADPPRSDLGNVIAYYRSLGCENILALRGDPEEYEPGIFDDKTHFQYASDLVHYISANGGFCIGVGVYPEGHIEASNLGIDTAFTKKKIDMGASFAITQMFFENFYFYDMIDRFQQAAIKIPVIAGIMPITDFSKVERLSEMAGVEIPVPIVNRFEETEDPDEVIKIGIDLATEQCLDLWENGVRFFHFYTLNHDEAIVEILNNLSSLFKASGI